MNFEAFLSNTETRNHSHSWGQIQLISGGILEMEAQGTRFLALAWRSSLALLQAPFFALWPPDY